MMLKSELGLRNLLLICLLMSVISGCLEGGGKVIDSACTSFKPIIMQPEDKLMRSTENAIIVHNRMWVEKCDV